MREETLQTDVLVIGGGPAGTWAAIKAVRAGADVVLVDKGHTGSSGATASVGTGIWYVDDVPELREAAMASREALGGHLAERDWMSRVLDETHSRMAELATVQRYPFPEAADGRPIRNDLQGPEYMRRQRIRVQPPVGSDFRDTARLDAIGLLGGYRRELGWGSGRALGARTAVGPEYPD